MREEKNYSLLAHNTFAIPAKCRRFVEAASVDEVIAFAKSYDANIDDLLILGGGSNVLFTNDYSGTVFHSAIKGIDVVDDVSASVLLRVGSGEVWDDVVEYCVGNSLYGAENLSAIPGEVGASAVQNIGAYGAEVKDIIYKMEAVDISTGKVVEIMAHDCRYAYRDSRFKNDWKNKYIITNVTYKLSKQFEPRLDYGNIRDELQKRNIANPTAAQLRQVITDIRNSKLPDPKVEGNAGSFFMNPIVGRSKFDALKAQYPTMPYYDVDTDNVKIPAGWLIDQCGWKGKTIGNAGVHSKQALVLINRGGAAGTEIVNLCKMIVQDVKSKYGVELVPEVNIV